MIDAGVGISSVSRIGGRIRIATLTLLEAVVEDGCMVDPFVLWMDINCRRVATTVMMMRQSAPPEEK